MNDFKRKTLKELIAQYDIDQAIDQLKGEVKEGVLLNELTLIRTKHSILRSTMRTGVEDYSKMLPSLVSISSSLLSLIDAIPNQPDINNNISAALPDYVPQLNWKNWRGGHFLESPNPIIKSIERLESKYFFKLNRLKNNIDDILSNSGVSKEKLRFLALNISYLDKFIPNELRGKIVLEIDLIHIYVVACRSLECLFYYEDRQLSSELKTCFLEIFQEDHKVIEDTNRIVEALINEKDTVSFNAMILQEKSLDFVLAVSRFIYQVVYNLILFPEKRFTILVPFSRFTQDEISKSNFTITRIDLNYNLHEVSISAVCNSAIAHQMLATLTDDLNQTLNKLNYALDQFYISILRVKLYAKNSGYQGNHHEFKTQINTIISMFMGEELYGDRNVFVRELIQNARDAVITRKVFEENNNRDYVPSIKIELNRNTNEFICSDNGIGMDRSSINRYLSDIGRSFYTSEDYSKLIAGNFKDFSSPISRFGIGLLSCFLVSNKIVIRTRKPNSKIGYRIDIPSRGAFFFMKEDDSIDYTGTEVKLELIDSNFDWNRSYTETSVKNFDAGVRIKYKSGDEYSIPGKGKEAKLPFIKDGQWRAIRGLCYYVLNLNVDIRFREAELDYIIPANRLFSKIDNDENGIVIRYDSDHIRFRIKQGDHRDSRTRVVTSGGIYVQKVKNLNLSNLNIPNWDTYVIDIAPGRVRMNLARDTMLSFAVSEQEKEDIWNSIVPTLNNIFERIPLTFHDYYNPDSNYGIHSSFLRQLGKLPASKGLYIKEWVDKKYKIFLFKIEQQTIHCNCINLSELEKIEIGKIFYWSDNGRFLKIRPQICYTLNRDYQNLTRFTRQEIPSLALLKEHSELSITRLTTSELKKVEEVTLEDYKKLAAEISIIQRKVGKEVFRNYKGENKYNINTDATKMILKEYSDKLSVLDELLEKIQKP